MSIWDKITNAALKPLGFKTAEGKGVQAVVLTDIAGAPVSIGGGGGSTLSDVLLTDANSVLFIARDSGTAITYARVDTGAAYTPVLPVAVAGLATGQKTAANSLSVVLSSDGPFATNFGLQADSAATSDTGSFSFMAFVKRLLGKFSNSTVSGALTTLSSTLTVAVGPQATVGVQITGNGAGFTLVPEASMDGGTTWITVGVIQAGSGAVSTPVSAITANGNWEFSAGGYTNFRLRNSIVASSGAVTGTLSATFPPKFIRSVALGDQADTRATWYDSAASLLSHIKLAIAAFVGAGSHVYGYNGSNQMTTDAWTLFGTTRTKTYTYTGVNLTGETDWV